MQKLYKILIGVLVLLSIELNAEIQHISIHWTSSLCTDACVKTLDRELKKVNGINDVVIDQAAGKATLSWKPNVLFQYTSISNAMRMVGLSMRHMHIRVRGKIQPTGETIYLISEGDNTRFELANPPNEEAKRTGLARNFASRVLSPELRQQLLDAYNKNEIAIVEGGIFMPRKNLVPTQVVVEKLSFEKKG